MNHHRISLALSCLALVAGCGRTQEPSPSAPAMVGAASSPGGDIASSPGGGGDVDLRPRVRLTSFARDASSIGTEPRILFNVQCSGHTQCAKDPVATAALVGSHVRLVDEAGAEVPLVAVPEAVKWPEGTIVRDVPVAITVKGSLKEDGWYKLQLSSDQQMVIGSSDMTSDEHVRVLADAPHDRAGTASVEVPFFTGSAPHLVGVTHTTDPQKPLRSVVLTFSEAVKLASAARSMQLTGARGAPLQGCVWSAAMRRCTEPTDLMANSALEFVFAKPVTAADLASIEVHLGGDLVGGTRSVAEGAAVAGFTLKAHSVLGRSLGVSVAAADWHDCTGSGDTVCFHETSPRL